MKFYLMIIAITVFAVGSSAGLISWSGQREDISQNGFGSSITSSENLNSTAKYGAVPLNFETNVGQIDGRVKFLTRGGGYSLFLTADEAVLALQKAKRGTQHSKSDVLRMKIVGADTSGEITGENPLEGKTNYIIGNDSSKWKTDIPNFERVRYANIYNGVDVVYYGNGQQLEYDFVIGPGADPRTIALEFNGANRIKIDELGDLVLSASGGEIRQHKPIIYQEIDGERRTIEGRYIAAGKNRVGLDVKEYDHTLPLVIDPVLSYSTYLGGNSNDQGNGIAVDSVGNAYVTGLTQSTNFPNLNSFQVGSGGGSSDLFVTKLNSAGNALVYSTYIGGSSADFGNGIAVDALGNAYITGRTDSTNFPLQNALQGSLGGGTQAFVAKLNASGNAPSLFNLSGRS